MYVRVLCLYAFGFSVFRLSEPGTVSYAKKKVKLKTATLFFLVLAVDFGSSRTKKLN